MPIQAPQWTEYLSCPVCANGFELKIRLPISLGCGHTICKTCLANLQRHQCPFDQCAITIPLTKLPVNTALVLLLESDVDLSDFDKDGLVDDDETRRQLYRTSMQFMEKLALLLKPSNNQQLSRPMQRKLVSLINCQPLEEEGRCRAVRAARSLGERSVTELILQHQNPQQLSANLWAAVRTRGCQFLGPAMQEEVLKLVLLALEDGSALSRKVLVMFVVQRLEPRFPQASKTSIGHVVQLLYRASCFKVTKRDGDSSLMQLKEEFRTYETLRREHDAQIVQIATEAGLRIAPDQWSSLLYGDSTHKSHMQSIIDKLQTPQSFLQSVQELVIALQRTGDPGKLSALRDHLDLLSGLDSNPETTSSDWTLLNQALEASEQVVLGLLTYMSQYSNRREGRAGAAQSTSVSQNMDNSGPRYKTSMCRDLSMHGSCPRGKNCTFAHSALELDQFRNKRSIKAEAGPLSASRRQTPPLKPADRRSGMPPQQVRVPPLMTANQCVPPVAQVAPVPRGYDGTSQQIMMRYSTANPPPPNNTAPVQANIRNEVYAQDVQQQIAVAVPAMQQGPGQHVQPAGMLIPHPQLQVHGYPPIIQAAVMPVQDQMQGDYPQSQQLYYHTMEDVQLPADFFEDDTRKSDIFNPQNAKVATKSLSALKTRKEEIIDSLQNMVGEEETKKISERTVERASTLQKNSLHQPEPPTISNDSYCMWTSRVFTPVFSDASAVQTPKIDGEIVIAQRANQESEWRSNDDVIPFGDSPQISRFGPISRRSAASVVQSFRGSQTQAIIDDETQSTAVVTNSKQMARPAPPIPQAVLHQNGGIAQLQPVAVGMNGEIEFIVVPPPDPQPQSQLDLRHIHNPAIHSPVAPTAPPMPPPARTPDATQRKSQNLYAESQRMKHELEILQQKISSLNLAKMDDNKSQPEVPGTSGPPVAPMAASDSAPEPEGDEERKDQLTYELQLIENTILDRELEISINHQGDGTDQGQSVDYGSYIGHGMVMESGSERTGSVGITTTARSGQTPRTNGRFFESF